MRFRYRSEEEMKDSGVEWIGKIPREWGLCKVKNIVKVKDGTHDTPKYVDPSTDARPLVTSKDIKNGKIYLSEAKYISYNDYILINNRSDVKKGDVIMPMIGTVGNPTIVDISDEFSIKNVALFKTCNNQNLSKFITYVFESIVIKEQLNLLTRGGVQNFASLSMLQNLKIVNIPNTCLNIILSFLDKKTSQFDIIISKKEALIETLEEAKKSLISEVVTGKVKVVKTSDGYELVERKKEEMKDSGVEWLGDIPKNWSLKKIKYVFTNGREGIRIGPFGSSLKLDEMDPSYHYKVYGQENLIKKNFDIGDRYINKEKFESMVQYEVKEGDILVSMMGTIGKCQVVPKSFNRGIIDSHLIKIRINKQIVIPEYVRLIIDEVQYIKEILKAGSKGSIMDGLNSTIIKSLPLPICALEEQRNILDCLENKILELDILIDKVCKQIEALKEAKQSLISEAVTGKIEILD